MQKTDSFYIVKLLLASAGAGLLAMIAMLLSWVITGNTPVDGSAAVSILTLVFIIGFAIGTFIVFMIVTDKVWNKNISKLEATFPERSFTATSTFNSKNVVFYIDVPGGKIAMITKYNPAALQMIDARAAQNIKVSDGKGSAIAGTTCVSFSFDIEGQKWKIPTLTAERPVSLKSEQVMTALAKADMQVERLVAAQKMAARSQ